MKGVELYGFNSLGHASLGLGHPSDHHDIVALAVARAPLHLGSGLRDVLGRVGGRPRPVRVAGPCAALQDRCLPLETKAFKAIGTAIGTQTLPKWRLAMGFG
jgi:hypothetical protein